MAEGSRGAAHLQRPREPTTLPQAQGGRRRHSHEEPKHGWRTCQWHQVLISFLLSSLLLQTTSSKQNLTQIKDISFVEHWNRKKSEFYCRGIVRKIYGNRAVRLELPGRGPGGASDFAIIPRISFIFKVLSSFLPNQLSIDSLT